VDPVNHIHPTAKPQYSSLPARLVGAADVATNGEFFWPGYCAADAARAVAGQGRLITGGEVYCRRAVGWAAYLGAWNTRAAPDASWSDSVERALREALQAIESDPSTWGELQASRSDLRFFLASVAADAD
jgi:hypothetical protein